MSPRFEYQLSNGSKASTHDRLIDSLAVLAASVSSAAIDQTLLNSDKSPSIPT